MSCFVMERDRLLLTQYQESFVYFVHIKVQQHQISGITRSVSKKKETEKKLVFRWDLNP